MKKPEQVVFESMRFMVRSTGDLLDRAVKWAKDAGYSEELAMTLLSPLRVDHHGACAGLNLVLKTWEGAIEEVSDTPKLADESKRLLDNGWQIKLWKNDMGSYSAKATNFKPCSSDDPPRVERVVIVTDDFEPSQALYRLTEKIFGNIV